MPAAPTAPTPTDPPRRTLFSASAAANDDAFTPTDWALFLAVSGIWGASFLLIDIGLDAIEPGLITLLRVGLGALALNLVPAARHRFARDDGARVLTLAVVWVAIPFTLFPLAEQHINSSVAGLLNGGTPIFTAVVATVLVRQPPGRNQILGIAVGFAGLVAISLPSIGDGATAAGGVAMVVAATLCYGFAVNIAAPLQARYGAVPLMARVLALATVMTVPYGAVGAIGSSWAPGPWAAVALLGVVGTGLAFALMATLVGRVGSTRASFITYLVPVVSLALGTTLRGDRVAPLALAGVVLVIAGAFTASRRA